MAFPAGQIPLGNSDIMQFSSKIRHTERSVLHAIINMNNNGCDGTELPRTMGALRTSEGCRIAYHGDSGGLIGLHEYAYVADVGSALSCRGQG